jgi:uncharacterized membrane protein required for colicin V production
MTTNELVDQESGADQDPSDGAAALSPPTDGKPDATNLAIAAAGVSVIGFITLFRLTSVLDRTRARALRRFLAVFFESLTGVGLGCTALSRLRSSQRSIGAPFAVVGVVLGASNVVRVFRWLRLTRPAG